MGRPQELHRPFFTFGNPFRMISPKGSQLTPKLISILTTFEETLAGRLRKLIPNSKDDILSFSWMNLAVKLLSDTLSDIKTLIIDLELPVSDWDEKWIDVYLDISIKLLDLCIAFSSELSRMNQGHLMLQYVLHSLDSTSSKQFSKSRSSLNAWEKHVGSKNPSVENCSTLLDSLVQSLDPPKVKSSAKGKVLMLAMYGVKVQTLFICSVFASAFSGSANNLFELKVVDTYRWAQAYTDLQKDVNGEIKNIYSCGSLTPLKEVEAVDLSVKKLYPMIPEDNHTINKKAFEDSVSDLGSKAEKLSEGLDLLTKEVDSFFQIVLSGRDALLSNLRSSCPMCDPMVGERFMKRL